MKASRSSSVIGSWIITGRSAARPWWAAPSVREASPALPPRGGALLGGPKEVNLNEVLQQPSRASGDHHAGCHPSEVVEDARHAVPEEDSVEREAYRTHLSGPP